jgi:hypothetical protein
MKLMMNLHPRLTNRLFFPIFTIFNFVLFIDFIYLSINFFDNDNLRIKIYNLKFEWIQRIYYNILIIFNFKIKIDT